MNIIRGTSTFPGIAIGKLLLYEREEQQTRRYQAQDVQKERQDFHRARNFIHTFLTEQDKRLLNSDSFIKAVEGIITSEKVNAYYAVMINRNELTKNFSNLESPAVRERLTGIRRISDRLMLALGGLSMKLDLGEEPFIICSDYLSPSELMEMDREKLQAVVTRRGSTISHMNIVAKNMELPNLVEVVPDPEWNGKLAIVDGYSGRLYIEPDETVLKEFKRRRIEDERQKKELLAYRDLRDLTADQKSFKLFANIGNMDDLHNAVYYGAAGIGLFRSEFQYLGREGYPEEEELFLVYRQAAEAMRGRPVIIRTSDLGMEKQEDYLGLPKEANPLMGNRGIRLCLDKKDMFRVQLRAVYRASVYGNVGIMFPMITSEDEMDEIEELVREIKKDLTGEKIPFKEIRTGIMVETPAAVMISRELARRVDFLALGTNDLAQYTLAMDRSNPLLRLKYDDHHPAVLRMIRQTVEAGHAEKKQVYICGELASDTDLTETFLRMGVDALSVGPACILPVRKALSEISLEEPSETRKQTKPKNS